MPKVVIDPGHGGYDPGAVGPGGLREKDITLLIGLKVRELLVRNGLQVAMTRETDTSPGGSSNLLTELNQRVNISEGFMGKNGLFVSIHLNSIGGNPQVDGTETLVYSNSGEASRAAHLIQQQLVAVTGVADRGVKAQNVLVLRKTSCPAVLTESVFISNRREDSRLRDQNFLWALAIAHAKGICSYFGINFQDGSGSSGSPAVPTGEIYRVKVNGTQIGAFRNKENAINLAKDTFSKASVGTRVWIEQKSDGKIIWDQTKVAQTHFPTPNSKTPILGENELDAATMDAFVRRVNPGYKYDFAGQYLDIGAKYGVRGDLAFAQSIHETGYFRFRGRIPASYNNFAGLGATGSGVPASFSSRARGIQAQIQHLFAYASIEPLKEAQIDPRFKLVQRGIAPNWEDLGGRWAVPGINYGEDIVGIWQKMKSAIPAQIPPAEKPPQTSKPSGGLSSDRIGAILGRFLKAITDFFK